MRRPVIAGNWKLNKTIVEAVSFVKQLSPLVSGISNVEIVIAPVFTALSKVSDAMAGSNIKLSAQDCFWEPEGAFTGEVSPALLKDAGCSYVIVGHSERRQFFGESDTTVNKKVKAVISNGLAAIVCVGETLEEREAGQAFTVVGGQVDKALEGLTCADMEQVVIAYEPVWAIGTGRTATMEQAQEVHEFIRSRIEKLLGIAVSAGTRILYGGSVKPDNVKSLMAQADVDGALIGGASLNVHSFSEIAASCSH
jgi:triosephosphate isomerase